MFKILYCWLKYDDVAKDLGVWLQCFLVIEAPYVIQYKFSFDGNIFKSNILFLGSSYAMHVFWHSQSYISNVRYIKNALPFENRFSESFFSIQRLQHQITNKLNKLITQCNLSRQKMSKMTFYLFFKNNPNLLFFNFFCCVCLFSIY